MKTVIEVRKYIRKLLKDGGILPIIADVQMVGSRTIEGAAKEDSDYDFAVLLMFEYKEVIQNALTKDGWECHLNDDEIYVAVESNNEVPFYTDSKGETNLIIYERATGFDAFVAANNVAVHLNLTKREDRVELFRAVCANRN